MIGGAITEAAFQRQVVQLAELFGWFVQHFPNTRESPAGWPDLVLIRERVIYAELKRQKGKPTPHQVAYARRLTAAGAEVYLWRPADINDIANVLRLRTRRIGD